LDVGDVHEGLPRGQPGHWQRRRVHVVQGAGLAGQLPGRGGDELGVRTRRSGEHRHDVHLVPDREPVHPGHEGGDDAGQVPAQDERWWPEYREHAGADRRVDRVDPGRVHRDQHFGGQGCGLIHVGDVEDVGAAEPGLGDRLHDPSLRRCCHRYLGWTGKVTVGQCRHHR
jgi:hypothetical protein